MTQMDLLPAPDYGKRIAEQVGIGAKQVRTVLRLFEEGNTIPFIARYRKEMTGELDENQLRSIRGLYDSQTALYHRKIDVLRIIEEQNLLPDPEVLKSFQQAVLNATTVTEVEDLYRPYRPKRKTRASTAKEQGLEPLCDWLLSPNHRNETEANVEAYANRFVSNEQGVPDSERAIAGALDIFAERVADDAKTRKWVRSFTVAEGVISSRAVNPDAESVYDMYYEYAEPVKKILPHRVLAMNRGERDGFLKVALTVPEDAVLQHLVDVHVGTAKGVVSKGTIPGSYVLSLLTKAVTDAYRRLIAPAISREVRSDLTEAAEHHAIDIFGENLKHLLLQPPLRGRRVLGVDPAYRTGCKLAVIDETGKLLKVQVIFPTPPQNRVEEATRDVLRLLADYKVNLIVIGNGTASRETESFIASCLREYNAQVQDEVPYAIVSEAGASVYSASPLAGEEFPDLDVAERSAVSIARRMQDPLAELVKIDPKAIGVGQYQHDVSQKDLGEQLSAVVESAVNQVGVDVNTASVSLLTYVSGLNRTVAKNIVAYRETNGRFGNRRQLAQVPRLGPKTLEQCVGFLRVFNGNEPLDATPIHPESYGVTRHLLKQLNAGESSFRDSSHQEVLASLEETQLNAVAVELGVGVPTLRDIVEALRRPGRDPRDDVPPPLLRTDVLKLEDLSVGMVLQGTVRNVVDFGAFVDIGLKNDGLVHISQLANHFVRHPMDVVSVGDLVQVRVIQVDLAKGRVGLSLRDA